MEEYFTVLAFFAVSVAITVGMVALAFILSPKLYRSDPEQMSAYECGFEAFLSPRRAFHIQFYLVSLLFIIFDLEVAFIFPWALALEELPPAGFWSLMLFFGVLTLGFVYEWKKKAFRWQ